MLFFFTFPFIGQEARELDPLAFIGLFKPSGNACADPESFVREGPALKNFLVDEGRKDPNTTICGQSSSHQRNTILMAFCWRADDGPTLNAGLAAL